MNHLKFAFVFFLFSLFVFYIAASLISATFYLSDMPKSIREAIFGTWIGTYVLGVVFYEMEVMMKNKPNN